MQKNSPEKQLIDEYIKRSGWEVTIKEHDNASQEEEAKFLLSSIPAGAKAVVLDETRRKYEVFGTGRQSGKMDAGRLFGNMLSDWRRRRASAFDAGKGGSAAFFRPADAAAHADAGGAGGTDLPHSDDYQPSSITGVISLFFKECGRRRFAGFFFISVLGSLTCCAGSGPKPFRRRGKRGQAFVAGRKT